MRSMVLEFYGFHWVQKSHKQLINIINSPQAFVYKQEDLHLNIGRQHCFPTIIKLVESLELRRSQILDVGSKNLVSK